MKVGLYFGSFNPIHVGHLIIVNYMVEHSNLDQIWLVVSPQNPHKKKNSLLADYHRLELVRIAIEDNDKLRASDIEFKLDKPSYTVNTLAHLSEKYPKNEFSLIMGEDNLRTFHKWKNYEYILDNYSLFVYPRPLTLSEIEKDAKEENNLKNHPKITIIDSPLMKISSSYIRKSIKAKKSAKYMLTEPVLKYVDEMGFYK